MIRTLLADDSASFRAALASVLREDPAFDLVGVAHDGLEALRLARALRPDLVVMDVVMPGMDGLATTARIMQEAPCPVVVMSTLMSTEAQKYAFEAMRAGAVEALGKPRDLSNPLTRRRILETLKAMATVKVVRRRATARATEGAPPLLTVGIGSSTGGPPALCEVLRHLPKGFPGAILIAQHLARGFAQGLAAWLADSTHMSVTLVSSPTSAAAGHVYLPADGHHLELTAGKVVPTAAGPDESPVPSVDRLFKSLAPLGISTIGVLLTGMGADGAHALRLLREHGGHTIVQDEATSLVYGMPRVAQEIGAAEEQLSLSQIGPRLLALTDAKKRSA